jgi:hypothetical protein
MAKKTKLKEVEHRKWERVYDGEDRISIWRYDSRKSLINPYEVEVKYKNEKRSPSKLKNKD